MAYKISTWADLISTKQYSAFAMAKLLFPDNSSRKIFKRNKFLLRSLLYRNELKKMFFLFQEPLLQKLPESYPGLLDKPLRPYQFARSSVSQRAQMMEEHYHLLSALFAEHIMPLYQNGGIVLGHLPDSSCPIVLRYDGTFRREGELTVSVINEHGLRLYSCAFSLSGTTQNLTLTIGSVQGPEPSIENAQDLVRQMTKESYGLRPKSLVIILVMMLAKAMTVNCIFAVKKSAHVFQAKRYSKKQKSKLQSNYDELWAEFDAREVDANFVQLSPYMHKPLEDIASKKRAMYRRRYEWLDNIEENINAKFNFSY